MTMIPVSHRGHHHVWYKLIVFTSSAFLLVIPAVWSFTPRTDRLSLRRRCCVPRPPQQNHHLLRHGDNHCRPETSLFVRRRRNNRPMPSSSLSSPLSVELSLVERDFYPILGSDDSGGAGCLAGPVVTATCCILSPAHNTDTTISTTTESSSITTATTTATKTNDTTETTSSSSLSFKEWLTKEYTPIQGVDDSKKLNDAERLRIYEEVTSHPETYAWHIAQRSNQEIDTSNIFVATMDSFQQSIEGVVINHNLLSTDTDTDTDTTSTSSTATMVGTTTTTTTPYSIEDGKKTPKLSPHVSIPCRPWVNGDASVYTISLASILAKVTHDQLAQQWHELYPEYGFNNHKGYATPEHIEAIHRYGPCPVHRLSFKALKGR